METADTRLRADIRLLGNLLGEAWCVKRVQNCSNSSSGCGR